MADQKIQLTVQVNADTGQLEVLGAKFNETSQKAKETTNAFGDLGEEAGNLIKRFLPFATGAGLLTFFVSAVKGAEEQNEAFRRLQFTLENSGKSWEANREGIEKWTNAVAISTRFSGNEAIATLEKFTRITGSLTQATAASQLAMGLSVKSHKELSETVGLVTDLLNGNERALIGVKREFASVAGGATTTQEALSRLQTAYGNAAKSTGTLTDEGASLSHSFDQLKDSVGNVFGPVLIWLADKLKMVIKGYQELGVVIAGIGAALTVNIGPGFKAAMTAILDETTNSIQEIENEKNRGLETGEAERLAITEAARNKAKAAAEDAAREELAKKEEQAFKIASIEAELEAKIASLHNQKLPEKLAALEAEVTARRKKIIAEIKDETQKQALLKKLNEYEKAMSEDLAKTELKVRMQTAFEIANIGVQTLQTLNSLGEQGSEGEKIRAKALLAVQQSLAIGWAWVNAMKFGGPFATGLAAAQTTLIVAQFAQGLQNIDKASSRERQGIEGISINPNAPGIDTGGVTIPNADKSTVPGVGTGTSPAGGTGGGPASTNVIFNGDIVIHGVNDASKIPDKVVDQIGERIVESIKGRGQTSFTGVR